jgi:serine/threonine protein phosphatase 1
MATVKSYLDVVRSGALEEFRKEFPTSHKLFLETLTGCYEDDEVLVSHAGFQPSDPSARTPSALYSKGSPDLFNYRGPWPKPLTICGHYVQHGGRPYTSPHLVCLDTGCGTMPGSPLTVLTLPDRRIRQF